jgi:hypothetical protein
MILQHPKKVTKHVKKKTANAFNSCKEKGSTNKESTQAKKP